ncbi:hypothetical protein [Streptococcus sp. S784/96/1]|uniref:hypothetical protein n=1 Tax=Streptococcus sp. S784/96/1 TaxID=2653499 RepID=UPI001389D64A|nr:hypothetical protein [Streptococcus sp. S784/96/1]
MDNGGVFTIENNVIRTVIKDNVEQVKIGAFIKLYYFVRKPEFEAYGEYLSWIKEKYSISKAKRLPSRVVLFLYEMI